MRPTKFGVQPAKKMIRDKGLSIAQAALDLGVKQSHLQSAVDGNICPNNDVRTRLPTLLDRPLDELFGAVVLNWNDQRGRGATKITCISDTDWWDSGHLQIARDVVIGFAQREARVLDSELVDNDPEREILSYDPPIWRFTWRMVK